VRIVGRRVSAEVIERRSAAWAAPLVSGPR
jgi:hypothetical protein